MRNTSARRRAGQRGTAYRGHTGTPIQRRAAWGPRARVDEQDEPLPDAGMCPKCRTPIRLRGDGTLWAHAAGGYGISIVKGWVACLGVGMTPQETVQEVGA